MADESPERFFLFTHARTTSNVLTTMLEHHPDITYIHYPMHDAFFLGPEALRCRSRGPDAVPSTQEAAKRGETYQIAFDRLVTAVASAEKQSKIPIVKEHVYFFMDPKVVAQNLPAHVTRTLKTCPQIYERGESSAVPSCLSEPPTSWPSARTNPTVLPDSFLQSMSPLILFRHPALMIPSFYRAAQKGKMEINVHDEDWPVNASLRWLRLVYDWYISNLGETAKSITIIDSDDLINSPEFPIRLCARLGIDAEHLVTTWEPKSEEYRADKGHMRSSFKSTLWGSTGIIRGRRRDFQIDLAVELENLKEEFGDEVGNNMARYIHLAMEDYYYLRERRFH